MKNKDDLVKAINEDVKSATINTTKQINLIGAITLLSDLNKVIAPLTGLGIQVKDEDGNARNIVDIHKDITDKIGG